MITQSIFDKMDLNSRFYNCFGITETGQIVLYTSGLSGASAYEIWLANGNTGTEVDFLNSLIGNGGDMYKADNLFGLANYVTARSNLGVYGISQIDSALGLKADLVSGKIPLSQIPDSVLGQLEYQTIFDASSGTPPSNPLKGYYWIISVAGTINTVAYSVGDWIIYNGTSFDKVDNTDAVATVFGRTGNIVATAGDYNASKILNDSSVSGTYVKDALNTLLSSTLALTGGILTGGVTFTTGTESVIVNKLGITLSNGSSLSSFLDYNGLKIQQASYYNAIRSATLTANRIQTLQDKTGTIALVEDIQNQTYNSVVSTGSANAYVLTISPAISAYAQRQKFSFIANFANTGTATVNINGLGAKTIKKLGGTSDLTAGDIQNGQVVEVVYNGTDFDMVSPVGQVVTPVIEKIKFGGDGSDGNLSISSGTTSLALTNDFLLKNYENITISGTAILDIIGVSGDNGAIAVIRCKGDFTMSAGTIKMDGQGGAGGTGMSIAGKQGYNNNLILSSLSGGAGGNPTGGAGGLGVAVETSLKNFIIYKGYKLQCGAGGGSGGRISTGTVTYPGRGGGILIIEVGGNINITGGTIQANGLNGGANVNYIGGAGGGGGGSIAICYNGVITSNTGTIQCNGGNGGPGSGYGGGGGGGSYSAGGKGGDYSSGLGVAGTSNSYGTGGAGGGTVGGGGGGAGYYVVIKNTEFA